MKLFIVTREPFPNGMAATNRIKCLAKAFISQGVDCKVVVFSRSSYNPGFPGIGIFEGIPYEYVGGSPKRIKGQLLGRIQSFLLQMRFFYLLKRRLALNDVVYGFLSSGKTSAHMIDIIHRKKAHYIAELCELPFGTVKETETLKEKRNYVLEHLFPLFDGVVAISDTLFQLAKSHCSPQCKVVKVPILVDFEKYDLPDASGDTDIPYIFHSGTLYEQKDGILGMIEAFGIAVNQLDRPIHFLLTGKIKQSPHSYEIARLIEKYGLEDKIRFIGYQTFEGLKKPLSEASLVILNKYPTQQNLYGFSTKLGEYLAAGKPVIITRVGEAMNWLTNMENAYIIEPNDTELLAKTIVKAFEDDMTRKQIGLNGKLLCKKAFDYHINGAVLRNLVNSLMTQTNE